MDKEQEAVINSIMNNPKLSRIIHEAVSAPLGSTKRAKAKSIISILKKTSQQPGGQGGYDGQGGPSIGIGSQPVTSANSLLKTTPSVAPLSGLSIKGISGIGSPTASPITDTSKGNRVVIFPNAPALKTSIGSNSGVSSAMSTLYGPSYTAPKTNLDLSGIKLSSDIKPLFTTSGSSGISGAPSTPKVSPVIAQFNADVEKQKTARIAAQVATTQTTTQKPDGTVSKTVVEKPVTPVSTQTKTGTSGSTGSTMGKTTPSTGGSTTTPTTGIDEVKYASLEDAYNAAPTFIKQNLGPEYFAQTMLSVMGDGQIDQLENTLKKSLGLDELLKKKTDLEKENPTIKQDLTDYVKARDEYIKDINTQMDVLDNTMATTDISNPVTNAMYQNYKDYLLSLKGKQNQRYADYVNRSIEEYNTDLTNTQNQYANALKLFNDSKSDIQSKYDNTKKVLVDMYKTLEDAPGKMLTRLNQQLTYTKLMTENADDQAGRKNWLPEVSAYKDRILDSNGEVLPDINLPGALQQLSGEQKYNPVGVLDTFTNGAKSTLSKLASSSSPTILGKAVEYSNQLDQAFSMLTPEAQKQLSGRVGDMKSSLINTIGGKIDSDTGTGTGITGYILSNYKPINNAVKQLSQKSTIWIGNNNKTYPTLDKFIKDNPSIDKDMLTAMYNSDQLAKSQLGSDYNIVDALKKVTLPNNTSGGASLVGLPSDQQLALYLTSRILQPAQYESALNQ